MPKNNKTKVCVAMSGGVDSSATAYMLKKEGYDVFGITMDLLDTPYKPELSSIQDAKLVADKIGIPHHFLDLRKDFYQYVVKYFSDSYLEGLTPSPCIMCNREIKLGILARKAIDLGADLIVTGHYADLRETPNGIELHRAKDLTRDQSYFLFAIEKDILQRLRCPLANYTKEQTRAIAAEIGLDIHKKSDSQDICFVSEGKYVELINKINPNLVLKQGDIVNKEGKVLGKHNGIINYTIGQRKGLGIGGGDPLYVCGIDAKNNQVIVGDKDDLFKNKLLINEINWLGEDKPKEINLKVKLRSRQNLIDAKVTFLDNNMAEVSLKEPFAGIAPGQGCCFYQDTHVLGGGFIIKD
ncbi:MAG: tRNA 2-thiouridine(34) synthase MnmA [Lactobacillus sp.]|jgi:tRNA-specific 2-thiouridylase|nr:tRNA 2-thiouridine(34) synthase MnmA [Lactobacillus sp.]